MCFIMTQKLLAVINRAAVFANNNPVMFQQIMDSLDDLLICAYSITDAIINWFKIIAFYI